MLCKADFRCIEMGRFQGLRWFTNSREIIRRGRKCASVQAKNTVYWDAFRKSSHGFSSYQRTFSHLSSNSPSTFLGFQILVVQMTLDPMVSEI